MALRKSKLENVPKDAVICTFEEAIVYQWGVIKQWPNLSDV